MVQNRRVVVNSRPAHAPTADNFRIETSEVDLEGGGLKDGEILVETRWTSVDPYLRAPLGLPGDEAKPSPVPFPQFKDAAAITGVGELFGGRSAGVVLKSKNPKVSPGDLVGADWKWEEYAIFNPDTEITFEILEKDIFTAGNESGKFNISTSLGGLGVSGSNAFFGFKEVLQAKKGETLVVSSAAGNIGIVAAQLGRIYGLTVIGIASGAKVEELKKKNIVDFGIDYKAYNDDVAALSKKLKELSPNGIDLYFDNVRGWISDAVYQNLNKGARSYICGGVSAYNKGERLNPYGNVPQVEGVTFKVGMDISKIYLFGIPESRKAIAGYAREGKLQLQEHVVEGFENIPKAFVDMYNGKNLGKAVVKVR